MAEIAPALRGPLRAALRGEQAEWPPLSASDVEALIDHGVAPLAYASGHSPELRREAMRSAAVEPLRLNDLREVLEALRELRPLILKGTALAYELYAAPEHRPRADTDLLVASIEPVREVLFARGFTEHATSGDEHGVRQSTFTRVDRAGLEHAYDVHWSIANSAVFADVLRYETIEPVVLDAIAPHAYALRRAEALLMACVHRVAHHHDSERLIWLADIALLRMRMAAEEHRRFWRIAAERRVVGVCMRAIELTSEWFGETGPAVEEFLTTNEITRDEPSRVFLDRELTYGAVTLANLRALSWRQRVTRLRQLAFPPASFMRESFPERGRAALPWLYVYRGARGVARLFHRIGTKR